MLQAAASVRAPSSVAASLVDGQDGYFTEPRIGITKHEVRKYVLIFKACCRHSSQKDYGLLNWNDHLSEIAKAIEDTNRVSSITAIS